MFGGLWECSNFDWRMKIHFFCSLSYSTNKTKEVIKSFWNIKIPENVTQNMKGIILMLSVISYYLKLTFNKTI